MHYSSTAARISAFFAASFVAFGIHLPFFPVLLASRGQDEAAIAVIMAVPIVLRVTTASWLGAIADRIGDRRRALVIYCALTVLGFLTLWPAQSFWALLISSSLAALFWNGVIPVTDALATTAVRRGEGVYGRMRAWGSSAFVVGNLTAGWVAASVGPEGIYWYLVVVLIAQVGVALVVPDERREETATGGAKRGSLAVVAGNGLLMVLLAGSALLQSGHAMLHGFASLYWSSLGFSGNQIGILWATGVLGEIVLFAMSGPVLARIGPRGLLAIGVVGAVARWSVFPFVGPSFGLWLVVQSLHAASFAAVHLGMIHVVTHTVAEEQAATAQGVMVSVNGSAMAVATLLSGPLYRAYGGHAFLAMAVIAAAGGVILAVVTRRGLPRAA
ncbi:MAG: MFS transporter [Siculibacillus sp.]